ncbi:MAG: 50S ribosomal protein L30 [Lysobacterales bacterium]|jgi:large subunit ribosomal protein L30|nr:MAG: 50S ribosomal protein L30 [Xanthomonadales bacterium]
MAQSDPEKARTLKVRLVKSPIGCRSVHRQAVRGLGLRRLNQLRELPDTPVVRGLIRQVDYLVRVED